MQNSNISIDGASPKYPGKRKNIRVVLCSYPGIFADTVMHALTATDSPGVKEGAGCNTIKYAIEPTIKLAGLVYSDRIFSKDERHLDAIMRLIKNSGWSYATLQFMQTDLYGFLRKILGSTSADREVPRYHTKDINSAAGLRFLKSLDADVILLANFNQKICAEIISMPRLACINIHPSLLPNYKGVDPVFAALHAGERELGVSVHLVDQDFDTGAILVSSAMAADPHETVFHHHLRLFQMGAALAKELIGNLPDSLEAQVKNDGGGYDGWPTKQKIGNFKKRRGRLIRLHEYVMAVRRVA